VLTTCQPSTVWCSRERLPAAAAQPAKVRQSCSTTDYYYYSSNSSSSSSSSSSCCSSSSSSSSNIEETVMMIRTWGLRLEESSLKAAGLKPHTTSREGLFLITTWSPKSRKHSLNFVGINDWMEKEEINFYQLIMEKQMLIITCSHTWADCSNNLMMFVS
jgi:hypothetical protein